MKENYDNLCDVFASIAVDQFESDFHAPEITAYNFRNEDAFDALKSKLASWFDNWLCNTIDATMNDDNHRRCTDDFVSAAIASYNEARADRHH